MSIFFQNQCLSGLLSEHGESLSHAEEISEKTIREHISRGTMVLLGNPAHKNVRPVLVGQPARVKINANIGTSPMRNRVEDEIAKLDVALAAGADTIMDLSIAGNLKEIRRMMLFACPRPIGTVPLYAVAKRHSDAGSDPSAITAGEILEEIKLQAEQGVDFMTVHCGVTAKGAGWASEEGGRAMGIVSRGGSILARWMKISGKENPFLTNFDAIVDIARTYNITLSLGDGLRPGAGSDAGDAAQWEEVIMLGRLAKHAREKGVQCMIEGPGHVRFNEVATQIQGIKTLCHGAPLYVLGPLVIDSCPGYDHIAGAIGGAAAVQAGADFLCYLTPAEHLTLPDVDDVQAGVLASKIAAQAGEVALGREKALRREKAMSLARKNLDWKGMREASLDKAMFCAKRGEHADEGGCAMCGDFCAVKMLQV